jgi:WD40 repeat protein
LKTQGMRLEEGTGNKVRELPPPPEERGESFYVVGGPVQPRRGCYIERPADVQLVEKLREGEYCHVLGPPQTGKSSLMARAARELRRQGVLTAIVDLSQTVGRDRNTEAGRWNYGVAYRIVRDLRLNVDLQHWWAEKKPLSGMQRINEFLWEIVLGNTRSPLVIFLDQIESVDDLDYAADLFHAVRACHDARASEPEYERLSFGLLGTAMPGDGGNGSGGSLYDVGRRIDLNDFTFEEARPLCREIGLESGDAERALYRIFYWTGGQPYLTQKLCRAISRNPGSARSDEDVDGFVSSRFFAGNAPQNEPNLRRVRAAAEQKSHLAHASLRLYRRLRKGRRIRYDRHQPEHEWLRITGLASVSLDGLLQQRNRIYAEVFNSRWIRHVVPFNWRGVGRWAAIVALAVGLPYWYSQVLPKGYVKTLTRPGMEFSEVQEAYIDLRRLPGFGDQANRLFARVLEQRTLAATSWGDALAADVELRALEGYEDLADALLGAFWNRQSNAAAASELRDQALVYQLRAVDMGVQNDGARARALIGDDYPLLVTGIRPGARIDGLGIDPAGRQVVTLTDGHVIQSWDAETGRATGTSGGFTALAEEFVTVRRRISIEAEGAVRSVRLEVLLRHPQATDVELRLVAPSGRSVVLPVRRQNREPNTPYVFDAAGIPELREFRREKGQGTWTLELEDRLTGTTGFLDGWVLSLSDKPGQRAEDIPGNPILLPDPRPTSQVEVVLSPDGRRAAAVSSTLESRGFLQVWDTHTGGVTARIPVQAGPRITAFDAEGQYLVTGTVTGPGQLAVWRAAAGQELLVVDSPTGFLTEPAFSVTGSVLAVTEAGTKGGSRVRLVDLADGQERPSIGTAGEISGLALGPDGRLVATLHSNNVVDVWSTDGNRLKAQLVHDRPVVRVVFDPSGRWLATVEEGNTVRVWSMEDRGIADPLLVSRETWDPLSVTFSGDGGMVLLRGRGRTFEVLSLPSGMPAAPPLRHSGDWRSDETSTRVGRPVSRAFDTTNTRVVTGRGGSMARVWNLGSGDEVPVTEEPGIAFTRVFALSPISDQVSAGGMDGSVHFLDSGGPWSQAPEGASGHAGPITALAYSPDGSRVVSVGADGSVLLWDPRAATTVGQRFHHGSGRVESVAVAADNRMIVTGGELGARLWDGESGEPGPVLGPGRRVASVAFSGDGQLVYTAAVDGVVQAWNADDGVPVWSGNMPGPVWSLAVSRDGRWVAAGEATGQMYLWDTSRLIGSRRMVQINGWPLSLAFDPRKESLFVQTAEWLHELSYGENPDIVASALLPAALPPGAWSVSADSAELARVLAVDSGGHRIVHLDLFGTSPGKVDVDAGSEVRWLDRLKLRFDATGALIPITAATAGSSPRSKPVGSISGGEPAQAEPAFQFNDEDREGPPPGLQANPQ